MIKIKQSTNAFAWSVASVVTICVLYLIKAAAEHKSATNLLLPFFGIITGTSLLLFLLHKGSYIKADENGLTVMQEYFRHDYVLSRIEKIYEQNHLYLGPTLFINYLNENNNDMGKRLLVVGNYNRTDLKNLLHFLKTKGVRLDDYCEKLLAGKE